MTQLTSQPRPHPVRRIAPLVLAAAALAPARAGDAVTPLTRHLEEIEVAPAVEHRLVVVHPLRAYAVAGAPDAAAERLGAGCDGATLALGATEPAARARVEVLNLADVPTVLLPGDVLRTPGADYAAVRPAVARTGRSVPVDAVRVSRDAPADPRAEGAVIGPVLPYALRHLVLEDAPAGELPAACREWADEIGLAEGRRSPAEFASGARIATRAADYRVRLAALPKAPAGAGIVGCAVLIDGDVAAVESFADPRRFAAAWPRILEGVAVEASLAELRAGLLEDDLAESADPDRFVAAVKDRLLELYAAKFTERDVRDGGVEWTLEAENAAARALLTGADRLVHVVLVTDPRNRRAGTTDVETDPNVLERRARLTEAEKRLLERRRGRVPPPPAPPGRTPAPAPVPGLETPPPPTPTPR